MAYAYINGKFVAGKDATISIKERGFRFGDGVFETIRIYGGIPYQWELHQQRLSSGLDAVKIKVATNGLKKTADALIKKNKIKNGILRISVSRGVGSQGYLPLNCTPTVVMETGDLSKTPAKPVDLWLSSYQKLSINALPSNAKTMQGLNSTLARMEAQENKCFEALQVNADRQICECSSGNIFWFNGDVLYTPALSCGLVAGTTRAAILRLSKYKTVEGKFLVDELSHADEVFICNAAWQILSVKNLKPLGFTWQATEKTKEIHAQLKKDIKRYAAKASA